LVGPVVQTRIDADVKDKATAVLEKNMGLTVSDAVRILLTRTANEGMLPLELESNSLTTAGSATRCVRPWQTPAPISMIPRSKRISRSGAPPGEFTNDD
jgi:addiction module RelB/DinJ family antitoxin